MRLARLVGRMKQVPALDRHRLAGKFREARAAPHIRRDAEVLSQQIGGRNHLPQDRAAAEELHPRRLLRPLPFPEQVHALQDAFLSTLRHRRMLVVLVHHRQVVEDVLLLGIHPAQAVLDDDGDLVREGRVIGDAVRDRGREQVAVPILVLQALAVERGAPRRAADQEAPRPQIARRPGEVADPLEAEHRVVDVERDHRRVRRRIRRRGRDPRRHGTGLVDALLEHLAGSCPPCRT